MDATFAVLAIAGSLAIGAASPGPSFVMVVRTAVAKSRRHGLAAALGMGVGGVVFCALALFGLQAIFARAEWLYAGFKIAGGAYLLVLAFRIWRHAAEPLDVRINAGGEDNARRSFALGLATQLSNPKTLVFYGSVFAALLPRDLPVWGYLVLPPVVMAIESGWYTLVALAFSLSRPRALYLRWKRWIDRCAAAVMAGLGLKLIFSSLRTA
ncbi:MAG TPA: LysE family transporter [Dongiaceae bacterium]|jgi:threonine/homoserine/homoserine lactone efflux protein